TALQDAHYSFRGFGDDDAGASGAADAQQDAAGAADGQQDAVLETAPQPDVAGRQVILRHDIDFDLHAALPFAHLEHECGVTSTYFVLTSSDFYNVNSRGSQKLLTQLLDCGHTVGLHFDRTRYGDNFDSSRAAYASKIRAEVALLESVLERKVDCLSMHQPSPNELDSNIELDGLTNAYSKRFFQDFDYFSDSVMTWRRDVRAAIRDNYGQNMQILTHPFWYGDTQGTVHDKLAAFINSQNGIMYRRLESYCPYFDRHISSKDLLG
ncbi:MAG: hypothetical protein LBH64_02985, partial [Coriobacteriales bacterium]|nr:hypothetical protein [Coriobacteriales bacterium]